MLVTDSMSSVVQRQAVVGGPDFRVPWLTGKQFPAVLMVVVLRVLL
jgi:hypothetical protein